VSGRITATLPLPELTRGWSVDIADIVRSNWVTEIDTDAPGDELELVLLVGVLPPPPEEVLLLLHAAAPRHKASDADAATAPFLTIEFINNLASKWEGPEDPHPGMREEPPWPVRMSRS
jgi:hypothetical protein